jgi:excisionase family DNA binding protein
MVKFLSVREVADVTGWSPLTVYKKSSAGEIPGRVKLGFSLRFRETEITKWLRQAQRNMKSQQNS